MIKKFVFEEYYGAEQGRGEHKGKFVVVRLDNAGKTRVVLSAHATPAQAVVALELAIAGRHPAQAPLGPAGNAGHHIVDGGDEVSHI